MTPASNGWGKEDDTASLLAYSEGSCPQLQGGGAAALVPPTGDGASTALNTLVRWTQCTANNTVFLSGLSLACSARESYTQYTTERWTQYTAKSRTQHTQHTAKSATGPGSHMPRSRPRGSNRYLRRAPGNGSGGRNRHRTDHVLVSSVEMSMVNPIREEEER